MAVWMPVIVVLRSLATYWIDTFMTELSSVMRNWAEAKSSRTKPDPERSRDARTAGSLGVPTCHGRDRSRAVRPSEPSEPPVGTGPLRLPEPYLSKLGIAPSWPIVSVVAGIGQYSRRKRDQEDGPTHLPLRAGPVSNGEFVPAGENARDRAVNELIRTTVQDAAARLGTDRRRFLQGAGAVAASLAAFELAGCGTAPARKASGHPKGGHFTTPSSTDLAACEQALGGNGEFIFDVHTHHVVPTGPWVRNAPETV